MASRPVPGMRRHFAVRMTWNPGEGEGSSTNTGTMAGSGPGGAAEQGATGPATARQTGGENNHRAAPNPTTPGTRVNSMTRLEFSRAVLQKEWWEMVKDR
ncbi:hypothetical protein AAFF_G00148420, partial [Aldrovandia affinis]